VSPFANNRAAPWAARVIPGGLFYRSCRSVHLWFIQAKP
jgi:hypothetical protein